MTQNIGWPRLNGPPINFDLSRSCLIVSDLFYVSNDSSRDPLQNRLLFIIEHKHRCSSEVDAIERTMMSNFLIPLEVGFS